MGTLNVYKSVRKAFPVTVLKIEKHSPVIGAELQMLQCTCCQQELGDRLWAIAWLDYGKEKRSARICEDCINEAEKPDRPTPIFSNVSDVELKASLVAIHYNATRLYNMLNDTLIEQKCIVHSNHQGMRGPDSRTPERPK